MKKKGAAAVEKSFVLFVSLKKEMGLKFTITKKSQQAESFMESRSVRKIRRSHAQSIQTTSCYFASNGKMLCTTFRFFALVLYPLFRVYYALVASVLLFQVLFCLYKPTENYLTYVFDNQLLKWNGIELAKVGRVFIAIKQTDLVLITLLYRINTAKDLICK